MFEGEIQSTEIDDDQHLEDILDHANHYFSPTTILFLDGIVLKISVPEQVYLHLCRVREHKKGDDDGYDDCDE
ncbi:hypothetical protein BLOT_011392 [Blomia tropicalis]|nr:hypothetical protein BLOT_011392 [Blomia tropicalis]